MTVPVPKRVALESLAPRYDAAQHETYLWYLQRAVEDSRNRNIALTGRYGTGKSSVLDEFVNQHKKKTLRVSISSLGATTEGAADLTNQLQKELVKQFIYRASPRAFRFSRFNRIIPLSRTRATCEAAAAVLAIGGLLWFFKVPLSIKLLPEAVGFGLPWLATLLSWITVGALALLPLTALRLFFHGRFVVSDISAVGATIKVAPSGSTYFDEYSEEIVYFFNQVFPEVVIFEDLDRFNDPHIFEALGELNNLLNETPKRLRKKKPLRFVYAIKDSLFERLDKNPEQAVPDAAAAETVRANRTKFFDVVIPVVPFLSHRNAQDFLSAQLKQRGVEVARPLVALIAQHTTDMRLLRNICNEYVIFAERLLKSDKIAPGLNADNLLALVAYKNFHLEDFERILRRDSDLDTLYERRRELVRSSIADQEKTKREILSKPENHRKMAALAERLGARMIATGHVFRRVHGQNNWQHLLFVAGEEQFTRDDVRTYRFWTAVVAAGEVKFFATHDPAGHGGTTSTGQLSRDEFVGLFPEAADVGTWNENDDQSSQTVLHQLDDDIALLRKADFKDLATDGRFTLTLDGNDRSFADIVEATMKSQLACDLVKQGYLDRNFALYAAHFYGNFTGVDVANFIVHAIEAGKMDIDFSFSGSDDIPNLLLETPEDFTRTTSAYNTAILNYLLKAGDKRAAEIADTIASNFDDNARKFLRAYLNSGSERTSFVSLLSGRPWPEVFAFLSLDEEIPADVRAKLVDAALRAAKDFSSYSVSSAEGEFVVENYPIMESFTTRQDDETAANIVALMEEMDVVLPDLTGLDPTMRAHVVSNNLYRLTADNLRLALNVTDDISLDHVCKNNDVFERCRLHPKEYLAAVSSDSRTPHTVLTEEILVEVLNELPPSWDAAHLRGLIARAAPGSALQQLDRVPKECWGVLAAFHLFRANVRNVRAYSDSVGAVDSSLADLLLRAKRIDSDGEEEADKLTVAVSVLKAAESIPDPRRRVSLAKSLGLQEQIPPAQLEPEQGDFLALLLESGLVADSYESFIRFLSMGWKTIEPAIAKSSAFTSFMQPDLVSGFIPDLLRSKVVPRSAHEKILDELAQYVPHDDEAVLTVCALAALKLPRLLPLDQVARIARATRNKDLTLPLLVTTSPATSAEQAVPVLTDLGEPYSNLTTRAKAEFDVPGDEAHRKVFDRLKDASLIADFRKRPRKDVYVVKLG